MGRARSTETAAVRTSPFGDRTNYHYRTAGYADFRTWFHRRSNNRVPLAHWKNLSGSIGMSLAWAKIILSYYQIYRRMYVGAGADMRGQAGKAPDNEVCVQLNGSQRMSSESSVPTYIVQSDGLFREGLRLILSKTRFRAHGCAIDLEDLTGIPDDGPILFIVAVDANQAVIKIRSRYPLAFIVAVADESNPRSLTSALDDGANAALFNTVSPGDLVSTLQAVVNGKVILIDARLWPLEMQARTEERPSPPLSGEILWDTADEPQAMKLSAREIAILERIVQGESNKQVARFFRIAEPTVKAHVKAILRKIGASNRTQAAIWAFNHHLFDQPSVEQAELPALLHEETAR
jgi:two-component system nitrate/nitrite response regulator NarL